jgi:peptidoglycan/xylan/chitin deacetylase (PgdA/CDA1 family)
MAHHPLLRHLRYRVHSHLPRLYPGAQCVIARKDAVALTIDDGPSSATKQLLAVLDTAGITATFFFSGSAALEHPRRLRAVIERGHTVASHGFAHEDLSVKSRREVADDITRSLDTIEAVSGVRPTLFRPPYGRLHPLHRDIPRALGCRLVLWSMLPGDFDKTVSSDELRGRLDAVHGGDIVVLHDRVEDAERTYVCIHHLGILLRRRGLRAQTL